MKRLLAIVSLVICSLAFSLTAQAEVFKPGTSYLIKYLGIEYLYAPLGGNLLDGTVAQEHLIQGPKDILGDPSSPATGFSMGGLMFATSVFELNSPPYDDPNNRDLLRAETGTYIAVYDGIMAVDSGDGKIYFEGGQLQWHYVADFDIGEVESIRYEAGTGWVYTDSDSKDTYAFNLGQDTLQVAFDLRPGYATVGINSEGLFEGSAHFLGDVTDEFADTYWNNNLYGENGNPADIYFHATLKWRDQYFAVDDPAYISMAPTPEPGTFILMGLGLLGAAFFVRRQQKARM